MSDQWAPRDETVGESAPQFATRARVNEFIRICKTLPDPDPVLRKLGRGYSALRELLVDSHLESVWSIRCATVSGADWFISPGASGKKEALAAAAFSDVLLQLDVPHIIEEMMDAVALGFSPMEILWQCTSRWTIADVVGKPQEWFEYTADNVLALRTGTSTLEQLPENRFVTLRHRHSYVNPYGVKLFSKCFWPVTFKRNGFRWWTVFVEKYGGAFLYGKYPQNADEKFKAELLTTLEKMIADSVAVAPEGADIVIQSTQDKSGSTAVHAQYLAAANAEVSKSVLGQTLTTEVGNNGSYAAVQGHNLVRGDLALADRRRVAGGWNHIARLFTRYNFGADVSPCVFAFSKDRDLQIDRADRDTKLYTFGWRPAKTYLQREYGFIDEDFDMADQGAAGTIAMSRVPALQPRPLTCGCGCVADKIAPRHTMVQKFRVSRAEKQRQKALASDQALLDDYKATILKVAQQEQDQLVDVLIDAVGMARAYDAAPAAIMAAYEDYCEDVAAATLDNARHVATQVGARRG